MGITKIRVGAHGTRLLPGLMLVALICSGPLYPAHASEPLTKARAWAIEHLRRTVQGPSETGVISGLLYALAMDYRESRHIETERLMAQVEVYIEAIETDRLSCGALVDLRLAVAFLALHRKAMRVPDLDDRLAECSLAARPLDLAGALFLYCGFTDEDHRQRFPGALESLEAIQRPDGGFGYQHGWSDYYLSSHALFALHTCRGDPQAIRRGQGYLIALLPHFQHIGFIDGLLETLVMLNKMQVVIPDYEKRRSYIMSRIRSDGGICYFDSPGCTSHWHATSLLLELLRMENAKARQNP